MLRWIVNLLLRRKPPMLNVGDIAPDFRVLDQDGQSVSLADLKGKRFLLWFYPKAATPG